jgi:hypothetical protein
VLNPPLLDNTKVAEVNPDIPATSACRPLILPPELLDMIVSYSEPTDLANMRLACKALCNSSTPTFGKLYFANLFFVVTEISLQRLINVTANPFFGRCVKFVRFGVYMQSTREVVVLATATEHDEFLQADRYIEMMVAAMENLKNYGNIDV